jgi:hypothetical protein
MAVTAGENFANTVKALIGAEVSPAVEELRTYDAYHAANDGSCVYLVTAKKILNQLLGYIDLPIYGVFSGRTVRPLP